MKEAGFEVMGADETAVCPVFLRDELLAKEMAKVLLEKGLYTVAIGWPVTPSGTARVRMIVQAGHTEE